MHAVARFIPQRGTFLRLAHLGLRFERVEKTDESGDTEYLVGRLGSKWGMFDYSERDSIVS